MSLRSLPSTGTCSGTERSPIVPKRASMPAALQVSGARSALSSLGVSEALARAVLGRL